MQDQMNRMEEKLDKLLDTRHEHHGRITKLESQVGGMKWFVGVLLSTAGLLTAVISKHLKG